jgi:arsenate reductase
MAEAIVKTRLGDKWQAASAGTRPEGYVNPNALCVLAEIGIAHLGKPKPVETFRGQRFDLIVTLCDSAAEECPVWLGAGQRVHVSFPDPALAAGDEETVLAAFRLVRDEMLTRLLGLLESWPDTNPNPS